MLDLGFVEAPADDLYIYLSSLAETTTVSKNQHYNVQKHFVKLS